MGLQDRLNRPATNGASAVADDGPAGSDRAARAGRACSRRGRSVCRAEDEDPPRGHRDRRRGALQAGDDGGPARAGPPRGHGAARARPDAADARRAPADRSRDHGRHPRLRPHRAAPPGRLRHGGHGQRVRPDLLRARGQARADKRRVRRQRTPVAHHRQDRVAGRPACRRGISDGRCALARRLACERDHSAPRAQRPDAHDSEVLARPIHDGRPDHVRVGLPEGRAVPGRVRQGEAEHPDLGRYRHRQDDDVERHVGVRARSTSAS